MDAKVQLQGVVLKSSGEGEEAEYEIFDLHSVDAYGAELRGPVFFEVGEKFELRMKKDDDVFDLQAEVSSLDVEKESMSILFIEPDRAFVEAMG